MSQNVKRHAAEAFDGDHTSASSKKRRVRKRTVQETPAVDIDSTPTQHKQVASSPARPPKTATAEKTNRTKSDLDIKTTESGPNAISDAVSDGKAVVTSGGRHRKRGQHGDKKGRDGRAKVKSKAKAAQPRTRLASWALSTTSGGSFIDHDPIFTPDKQCVIVPTKNEVNVYSLSTSLLVRSIHVREKDTISGCCISSTDQNTILVATRRGYVIALDWTTGNKIAKWQIQPGLVSIISVNGQSSSDTLLAIKSNDNGRDELLRMVATRANKSAVTTSLLEIPHLNSAIIAASDVSVVVVSAKNVVYIGHANVNQQAKETSSKAYTWYSLPVSSSISSLDARYVLSQKKSNKIPWTVDVVIGHDNGSILIYDDILSRLIHNSKDGQKADLNGRKLHWHRSSVRSVKWSRDGNYLISGGDETVLVIWQLDTNQQQYLPHLSTSILNIQISQSGAEYALRLGDNSVMVLSTADLTPMTNITGLSLPNVRTETVPLLLHPTHPDRLLAAVSLRSIDHSRFSNSAATHLQTFDIDTNLQLYRQALTRNIITAVNVAPAGQNIQEPNVTHLQISYDGQWLATVDKWSPNAPDMQALYLSEDDQSAKQQMTETLLRFWNWNAGDSSWEVISRVDEPHQASKSSIIELASNPAASEFSTLGEDGTVKIWKPRKRIRDGVQVRDKSGSLLYNWACIHTVQVEPSRTDGIAPSQTLGTLAYSQDGSVLAASRSSQQRAVHFLDPRTGALCTSQSNLLAEGPALMAMTGRSLLCLSNDFKIFDMVTLQVTFTMSLVSHHNNFMAVNTRMNCVAVAVNPQERHSPASISIFDLENPENGAISNVEVSSQIRALLPETVDTGFVIIDNDCRVRKMSPPTGVSPTSLALTTPNQVLEEEAQKTFEDLFGADQVKARTKPQHLLEGGTERPQSLSELISATSTSGQLGINELFDRVSRAVSGTRIAVGA